MFLPLSSSGLFWHLQWPRHPHQKLYHPAGLRYTSNFRILADCIAHMRDHLNIFGGDWRPIPSLSYPMSHGFLPSWYIAVSCCSKHWICSAQLQLLMNWMWQWGYAAWLDHICVSFPVASLETVDYYIVCNTTQCPPSPLIEVCVRLTVCTYTYTRTVLLYWNSNIEILTHNVYLYILV